MESDRIQAKHWKIIGVVILAPLMSQMDSTIVNVSLSAIKSDLHATIATTQWVVSGYLLALALMLPVNGWLIDRFGAKKLYLFCFSAFTFASFLCGAARSIEELIAARILQGMAGGLLAPLTQFMIARIAGNQMARVIGIAAMPVLLAPLLGPPIAGAILKYYNWPWLFYVNLPVGILAVILAAIILPHEETSIKKRAFDIVGFLLLSPGLAMFMYGVEKFTHNQEPMFFILGIVTLLSFIFWAKKKGEAALIDLKLFKIKTFSVATITQFLSNGIIYAGQFLVPLYLITGAGLTPTEAGWVLIPMGIGMMCVYPLMGQLTDRFGCRSISMCGILTNFLGTLPFFWMIHFGFSVKLAILGLFLRGAGQGATGIPSIAAAYSSVPKEKLSFATTSVNIIQRLGGPVVTTILGVVTSLSLVGKHPEAIQFQIPFCTLLIFQFCILMASTQLPKLIHTGE